MNETQRNIKRYRAALPGLREKIAASAMLLVVSLSMMVSASFAWYSISSAPEVSMMSTTVAANGNLEIALADGLVKDPKKVPNEVAIGDSSATENKTIVSSNITWGNLVNLSDSSYGLGAISLRPALLGEYNLGRLPLHGAIYSNDGRVESEDEYYRYTSYTMVGNEYDFSGKPEDLKYGVRAISSVKTSSTSANAELNRLFEAAELAFRGEEGKYNGTVGTYNGIIAGKLMIPNEDGTPSKVSYMDALVDLLEIFVNDTAKETLANHDKISSFVPAFKPSNYADTVPGLLKLLEKYREVLDNEGDTLANLANMYIYTKEQAAGATKDEITQKYIADGKALRAADKASLKALGVADSLLKVLDAHKADYNSIESAISGIETHLMPLVKDGKKVYWAEEYYEMENTPLEEDNPDMFLIQHITKLVTISEAKVGSTANGGKLVTITQLAAQGATKALEIIQSDPIEVEIGGGVLANTEHRIGDLLRANDPKGLGTRVTINLQTGIPSMAELIVGKINGEKKAAVRTDASLEKGFALINEMNRAAGLQPEPTDIIKKDTYGFAIDFWVRTNGDNSILTLEGSPEYEERDAKCTNIEGAETQVWIASLTVELEGEETEDGTGDEAGSGEGTGTEGGSGLEDIMGGMKPTETYTTDVYLLERTEAQLDENGEPVLDENGKEVMVTRTYVYEANSHVILGAQDEMTEQGYSFSKKTVKVIVGYDGVDRIWEDMADAGLLLPDNTTQGSGSCYVFYAEPADQERILDMLQFFTIAFLDQNDDHKATAKLDVEKAYEINGKVTVPLKMVAGPEFEVTDETGAIETKRGIVGLTRGMATWLTAIVYLDGEKISNVNVMESGVVEGRLSLQFGSSAALDGQVDIELQQKYRTITAEVAPAPGFTPQSVNPITYAYDGTAKEVVVTLNVEGDQPKNITGFFTRMIGANHGTKMETERFDFVGMNGIIGTWQATFELTNPGEYRFLSVLADGIEYELKQEQKPTVKISGREIISLNCDPDGGVYYTSDNTMDITVDAQIAATPEQAPSQVRAVFSYGNGQQFTVNLRNTLNSADTSGWSGTATVNESGTYVLEYVYVDGEPSELTEEQRKEHTFVLKLGVKADIECAGIEAILRNEEGESTATQKRPVEGTSFPFERDVESFAVKIKVRLADISGNAIRNEQGIYLRYDKEGGDEGDKMDVTLRWKNDEDGYYEGVMVLDQVGIYGFSYLTISNDNVISVATRAPVITAMSPNPPAWDETATNITLGNQYVPTGGAKMYANFTDADTATAYALIRNDNTGETKWMPAVNKAEDGEGTRFEFNVPTNTVGLTDAAHKYAGACEDTQDGEWVMDAVCLQDVYEKIVQGEEEIEIFHPAKDKETENLMIDQNGAPIGGMFFSKDGSYYLDREEEDDGEADAGADDATGEPEIVFHGYAAPEMGNVRTVVSQKVFASTTATGIKDGIVTYGKNGDEVTGTFMQSHNASGVTVTVTNWRGDAFDGVYDAALTVTYQNNSSLYGGYTFTSQQESGFVNETWNLTSSDGKTFTLKENQDLAFAGSYNVTLKYKLRGDTSTETNPITVSSVYKYEIWSKNPTVTVNSVSTGNIEVYTDTRKDDGTVTHNVTMSGDFNKKNGEYTAVVYLSADGWNVKKPSVTLQLSGMPTSGFTATMVIPNQYDAQYNATYEFKSNNATATQSIGGGINGNDGRWSDTEPKIFPAGDQKVNSITVVYGSETFQVPLSNTVTIKQPQIPLYVDFAINNDAYPGAVPGRVVTSDGEKIVLVLPDASKITTQWTTAEYKDEMNIRDTKTANRTLYETWTSTGCNSKDMYQLYTETCITETGDGAEYTWTRTWRITGWKVGDTEYSLGHSDEITITTSQKIQAVIEYSDGTKTPKEYTFVRTTTYYTPGAESEGTPPAGFETSTNDDYWDNHNSLDKADIQIQKTYK